MIIERVVLLVVKMTFWGDDYCRSTGLSSLGQKPVKDQEICWRLDLAREDTERFSQCDDKLGGWGNDGDTTDTTRGSKTGAAKLRSSSGTL